MIASINSIFSIFNRLFFDSNLSAPEIIVDVSKKVSLRWQSDENIIVMGSGFVNINKEIICVNLLHEMIHLSNYKNKVIDVNDNQYHNSKFMKLAVKCGLVVYKDKNQGWSNTTLEIDNSFSTKDFKIELDKNQNLKSIISNIHIDNELLNENEKSLVLAINNLKPSKIFFLKYECSCPPPHNSIRSGRRPDGSNAPDIICDRCKTKFNCVSPLYD
jgi:hypothetical protein